MTVLALDLGLTTGFYLEGEARAFSILLKPKKTQFNAFYSFYVVINHLVNKYKVDTIIYEDAKFQQGNAIQYFHGFVGILRAMCEIFKIKLCSIPVKTVKKFFCGNGNADKQAVMDKCDFLGIGYTDHNAADAYAVYWVHKNV